MKYSFLLILVCSLFSYGQNKPCESKLDTLTKILVYSPSTLPEPEGGHLMLFKNISEQLTFPHQFRDDDCPKIMFSFIVNEFGKVVGLRVRTKKYDTIESQLTKILENTVWTPGVCGGKKVPSFITIPIAFKCG